MDFVTEIINHIPSETWVAIGGAAAVSVVLQKLKNWLSLQSDKVIMFLNLVLCFSVAAVQYIIGTKTQNPSILALQTFLLSGLTNPIYRYLVKPTSNLLIDAKELRRNKAEQVKADQEIKQVLPHTTEQTTNEFTA